MRCSGSTSFGSTVAESPIPTDESDGDSVAVTASLSWLANPGDDAATFALEPLFDDVCILLDLMGAGPRLLLRLDVEWLLLRDVCWRALLDTLWLCFFNLPLPEATAAAFDVAMLPLPLFRFPAPTPTPAIPLAMGVPAGPNASLLRCTEGMAF